MNVYDFDNTIYRGDSTVDFVLYCYGHEPRSLISLPRTLVSGLLYGLHIIPKLAFKQELYHMFVFLRDRDALLQEFVRTHADRIKPWYREQQRGDDLVISASPEFLIRPLCRSAGITHVLASRVDFATGRYDGLNCHGREKTVRFFAAFPEGRIEKFYSDSRSDAPLAELAESAYLVKGNQRERWSA